MQKQEWPSVVRSVHLKGGLRAISKPGSEVILLPTTVSGKVVTFNLRSYGDLIPHLKKENLSPYGIEYIQGLEQANGIIPPDWKVSIKKEYERQETVDQTWRNVTHTAHDDKNFELEDLASRISFELLACKFRLRDLSSSYNTELQSRLFRQPFEPNQWFQSTNSFSIILSLHSFFNEICTLRNFLAEFIASFGYPSIKTKKRVYSVKSLREKILSQVKDGDAFAKELWEITDDENGWLAELGRYRNFITHFAPISQATPISWMVTKEIGQLGSSTLPGVFFYLPRNIKEIERQRDNGVFSDPIEWIEKNKEKLLNPDGTDALDYAFQSITKIIELAHKLIELSPSKPQTKVITDSDIIGPIRISTY